MPSSELSEHTRTEKMDKIPSHQSPLLFPSVSRAPEDHMVWRKCWGSSDGPGFKFTLCHLQVEQVPLGTGPKASDLPSPSVPRGL